MMKKLLIFQPGLAPYRVEIYNELAKFHLVKVIFLNKNIINQRFDQQRLVRRIKVDFEYLTSGFRVFKRIIRKGVIRKIYESDPDVVVTSEFSTITITVGLLKLFYRKRFLHIVWTDDNPDSVKFDSFLRRLLRKLFVRLGDGFIVVSRDSANLYREEFNAKCDIGIVPIIQKETVFRSELGSAKGFADDFRSLYGLISKRVVLFVGRLVEEKGIDRLIYAFSNLSNRDNTKLVIVGEGEFREYLEALALRLGVSEDIIFVGRFEGKELLAWYRLADIFVLPSRFEPYGAVVNEALLAGVPVICSNVAGAKDLIQNGFNGLIVDAGNIEELTKSIDLFLDRATYENSRAESSLMITSFSDACREYAKLVDNCGR